MAYKENETNTTLTRLPSPPPSPNPLTKLDNHLTRGLVMPRPRWSHFPHLRTATTTTTTLLLLLAAASCTRPTVAFFHSSILAMSASVGGPITVVTGSNKGIGYEILKKLAPSSSVAVLAARNPDLSRKAVQRLHDEDGLNNVVFRPLDVSSPESIAQFAAGMQKEYGHVDVLVNNAGVAFKGADPTPFREQASPTLRTNFFGTIQLIDAMVPLLRKATVAHPCIVNVASQSGRLSILDTDKKKQAEYASTALTRDRLFELTTKFEEDVKAGVHAKEGWPNTCYGMSKLALISFGKVFAREEAARGKVGGVEGSKSIWLASCCPGWCDTDMSSHSGPRSAEHGARTPAYLALNGVQEGLRAGGFFYDEKEIQW